MMTRPVLRLHRRTEPLWVTFTDADQARPGRQMRPGERGNNVRTVAKRVVRAHRPYIVFTDGSGIDLRWAKQHGWQIEQDQKIGRRDRGGAVSEQRLQ